MEMCIRDSPEGARESYGKRGYPMKILAIDIGGTALKAGLVDESAQVLEFREAPTFEMCIRDRSRAAPDACAKRSYRWGLQRPIKPAARWNLE